MKAFGIVSDWHLHPWTNFAEDDEDGVNSRFRGLLRELRRCALEVKAAGGDTIYGAGDAFHVRGNVSPLVLNPTIALFKELTEKEGMKFRIISGNHDLQRKHSERLSSAITALEMPGVEIINEARIFPNDSVVMIPWHDSAVSLQTEIMRVATELRGALSGYTLIIHAPVNGVIPGLPDTGIDPCWLAKQGFKRVLSGHYHNFKDFGDEVYSIGALAHHSWSDVGSKAGFLLVGADDKVNYRKSHLPEFLDLDQLSEFDAADIPLMVDGNYVRVKTDESKTSVIEKLREELVSWGAKGVLIRSLPKAKTTREGAISASVSSGASIAVSVGDYIKSQSFPNEKRVNDDCVRILSMAGVAA